MSEIKLIVEKLDQPVRIDQYLASAELGLSRSQIKRLFGEGRVVIDERKVRVSFKVAGGEEVIVDRPEQRPPDFLPEDIPIDIIFEDDHLAVVNKPAGMVTHPAPGHYSGTLANALLHHFHDLSAGYSSGYPGLVHRLDKNTSGLLLVARNDQVHRMLGEQLQSRELCRQYLALVWGKLRQARGSIEIPIGRSRGDRRVMSSAAKKLREAITEYEVIEELEFLSYVRLNLKTGRTHQIRAHMKEMGRPVFGDPEYAGRGGRLKGIEARHRNMASKLLELTDRQLLHAAKLEFVHPLLKKEMSFECKMPDDFGQILKLIRLYVKEGYS